MGRRARFCVDPAYEADGEVVGQPLGPGSFEDIGDDVVETGEMLRLGKHREVDGATVNLD